MARGTVFLGRERELAELRSALDDLRGGRGSLFLLVGEPGIGKTRLADEACDLAADRGLGVRWGRCWDSDGAPAYWPWAEIVSSLWDEAAPSDNDAATLATIVPERTAVPATAVTAAGGDADATRFRIFRAATALLARASSSCAQTVTPRATPPPARPLPRTCGPRSAACSPAPSLHARPVCNGS
jgi:hypothetical protein